MLTSGSHPVRVSIVVPTHHRPGQLHDLLKSLEQQTYPRECLEVVLVPSPDDPAFQIVREYQGRGLPIACACIPGDPWQGRNPSAKRNFGARQARGEWLAFIDDDCIADPEWIAKALPFLADPAVVAVEGCKVIPPVHPPTVTYKGLLVFTRPGGFQTCNMFYRRDLFLRLGGFDLRFPFYLEDSDLAWSVIDQGYTIPYAAESRVLHPVGEPVPWRLLDEAKRSILLPLLRAKHPVLYRRSGMRGVRRAHWPYLVAYAGLLVALLTGRGWAVAGALGAVLLLALADMVRRHWGCQVRRREVLVSPLLLLVVPLVSAFQFGRGVCRHGLGGRSMGASPTGRPPPIPVGTQARDHTGSLP